MTEIPTNPSTIAGEFSRLDAAQTALMALISAGVPAELLDQAGQVPTYDETSTFYVWVPGEFAAQAQGILSPSAVSNDELTREALESPPPDDA